MWSRSHLIEGFRGTHGARKHNLSFGEEGGQGPGDCPPLKAECFKNTLPSILKTESVLNRLLSSPFLSAFMFEFAPKRSQVRARRKFAEAAPGRDAGGTVALSSPGRRVPARGLPAPLPPAAKSLRGHLVIRCPSDVFTFFLTADTSGAHIQVIPVPLDTFHKIISAVVMAIFLPPVIFKLHDRNSWS